MVKLDLASPRGRTPLSVLEKRATLRGAAIDHGTWQLMAIGEALLPLVAALEGERGNPDRYEELAGQIWRLLRRAWASWWPVRRLLDEAEAMALWEEHVGPPAFWEACGLAELLAYWLGREEGPEQLLPFEGAMLNNWLFGAPWLMKATGPSDPPRFPARLMLEEHTPFE